MTPTALAGPDLARTFAAYQRALERHEETINRLNVYPVPDGDTGTNMLRTIESASTEIAALDADAGELPPVLAALAHGSLMGARGNSGVILCQLMRGFADALADLKVVAPLELAAALCAADRSARDAVLRPVEGTILTVAAAAAEAADERAKAGADLVAVLDAARGAAQRALESTPELLAVLADAGVVDAGGAGLVLFFESLFAVATGAAEAEELRLPDTVATLVASGATRLARSANEQAERGLADGSPCYEVMYFLDAPDAQIAAVRTRFGEIGDSVVVVGGGGIYNCHVHTDDIGAAIEAGLGGGRPREIRVTDLREQVGDELVHREQTSGVAIALGGAVIAPVTSVVAIATGAGIARVLGSLGVASVLEGGQSMNPSTAEVLALVQSVMGRDVIVLPNNPNIIAVAEQAAELASGRVRVVPTKGIQEGLAALVAYDPEASGEANAAAMQAAASHVVAGEVTTAVRRATTEIGEVAAGQWIGLSRAGIEVAGTTLVETATELVDLLALPEHEILTLIAGAGLAAQDLDALVVGIESTHPELSIERLDGGQALYPLLVSLE